MWHLTTTCLNKCYKTIIKFHIKHLSHYHHKYSSMLAHQYKWQPILWSIFFVIVVSMTMSSRVTTPVARRHSQEKGHIQGHQMRPAMSVGFHSTAASVNTTWSSPNALTTGALRVWVVTGMCRILLCLYFPSWWFASVLQAFTDKSNTFQKKSGTVILSQLEAVY